MKSNIAGLILAAGYSSRMGRFKPLLPIGNHTAIEVLIDTFMASGVTGVHIVTGFCNKELVGLIKEKGSIEIYNEHFDEGMFSSIQAGIKGIIDSEASEVNGLLLGLVDSPLVSKHTMELVLEKASDHLKSRTKNSEEHFIIPCYQGKKGHPIYIPKKYFQDILDYEGTLGLKGFMSQYRNKTDYIETKDEAIVFDMDDKAGYEEMLSFYEGKKEKVIGGQKDFNSLKSLLGSKRLFLIRHCEQIQMGEKIFLGQTDLSLSEEGKLSAKKIGEKLSSYEIKTNTIYSSDLKRARETAQLIKETFVGKNPKVNTEIIEKKAFRELNLGTWDGKTIREIKNKFPEEYLERGMNLLGYKVDPLSENFYDLQYRVLKELKKILMETVEEDVIIVTHAGAINVILSNFNDNSLEKQLKSKLERGAIYLVQNREDL